MQVLTNFYSIAEGDQSWLPSVGDGGYAGGHAMVVVGYNDDQFHPYRSDIPKNEKGAFLLMNSWGKKWGLGGYIWVRYRDFAQHCKHAYALMLSGAQPVDLEADVTPNPNMNSGTSIRKLSGTFGFQSYTGEWFNDKPVFKEELVQLDGEHYLLAERKVGEQFQLKIKSDFAQGYIYAFSVDPEGKVEVHFPRSGVYNPKFDELNESALVMDKGSSITIPSATKALEIKKAGTDHLVVLFSERKIKPKFVTALGKQLASSEGSYEEELPRLLQKYMIPFSDITYRTNEMGFEVGTRSTGKIVPLVLRLESEL